MDKKITEKENYLRVLRGEQPEWVPFYFDACTFGGPVVFENKIVQGSGNPNIKFHDIFGVEHNDRERFTDMFGIDMTVTIDGNMPTPGIVKMTDLTKWREQLNYPFPDLDKVDFKGQADAFYSVINHEEKAVAYFPCGVVFTTLMNAMGVAEALCAMVEEPEACHELFTALTDFEEEKLRLSFPYLKPEVVVIGDDVATAKDLFMSPKMYTELIAPYHRRLAKVVLELGAIAEMHCCGRCEKLIPQWIDMGITVWQPAQPMNDLKGIKAKYGNKFVFNGVWATSGKGGIPGASEKDVRESVSEVIDQFAPGGGLVIWDMPINDGDSEKFEWTADEARTYGRSFYKK